MNILRWAPFPEADIASYHVYRSIIGFRALVLTPPDLDGKTLQLKMNGGTLQTITFDLLSGPVAKINATLTGGRAYTSIDDPLYFYVRSDVREAPGSVQIVGGTALVSLGLATRTITEKSEVTLIAVVAALLDPLLVVEYEDKDGVLQDWYAISSIDQLANESLKTAFLQPISTTGKICVLEGVIVDMQGVRVPDAEITARLIAHPQTGTDAVGITLGPVNTLSGPDGRFSLPLLQGAQVFLEIPAIRFSKNIGVPAKSFEFITDLLVDLDYRYPLGSEV